MNAFEEGLSETVKFIFKAPFKTTIVDQSALQRGSIKHRA